MMSTAVLWTLMLAGAPGQPLLPDAHRAHLGGDQPGSLAQPIELQSLKQVRALCAELKTPLTADPEEEADPSAAHERARARVYRLRLDPTGFGFLPYDGSKQRLSVNLKKTLSALDSGVALTVLQRDAAAFKLKPQEALAVRAARAAKRADVDVTFLVDYDGGDLSPCFGLAHSSSFSLVVKPLTWTVRDGGSKAQLASLRTSEQARLSRWVKLSDPELVVSVTRSAPGHDEDALRKVFVAASEQIRGCFAKGGHVVASQVAALSLTVSAAGAVASVRSELSSDVPTEAQGCLLAAAAKLALPRSARGGEVGILMALER